jgi:hypothetical protein
MSPQTIPLKGRKICGDPAEFWRQSYSRLSCGIGDTQLGFRAVAIFSKRYAPMFGHRAASL